ncbi:MAG TPA: UDP-N-acetylmuramate dehydrogenase [Acidimicrobiia bacterium]|nr:UDP-N-acetylmuramate dehydrogenase [Acidimicrobiia bacterium]
MADPIARLESEGKVQRDVRLSRYTTYKVGGPAAYLVEAADEEDVVAAALLASRESLPVLPLGRGSNVVVSSAGFPGVVVRSSGKLTEIRVVDDGVVVVGGGCPLPVLARETVAAGRGGLEFFTGIPGSVGGAVRMNAGCHGSETVDRLIDVRIVDLFEGTAEVRAAGSLDLSYRHSNLTDRDFVVLARFHTETIDPAVGKGRIRDITRWRRLNQPGGTHNAGSVFKNPSGDSAGRIIDSLGLKGWQMGGAAISDRHANFIVAGDDATPHDIHRLVKAVQRRVEVETGIRLEPELRFVGDFDD